MASLPLLHRAFQEVTSNHLQKTLQIKNNLRRFLGHQSLHLKVRQYLCHTISEIPKHSRSKRSQTQKLGGVLRGNTIRGNRTERF